MDSERAILRIHCALGEFMELIGVAIVALLYYFEFYALALVIVSYTAVNGVLGAWYSVRNPKWYAYKKLQAGLDVDISNPERGVRSLVITKIIFTPILLFLAWHIARTAGYL